MARPLAPHVPPLPAPPPDWQRLPPPSSLRKRGPRAWGRLETAGLRAAERGGLRPAFGQLSRLTGRGNEAQQAEPPRSPTAWAMETQVLTPHVYWAQRHRELYLRVELSDVQVKAGLRAARGIGAPDTRRPPRACALLQCASGSREWGASVSPRAAGDVGGSARGPSASPLFLAGAPGSCSGVPEAWPRALGLPEAPRDAG